MDAKRYVFKAQTDRYEAEEGVLYGWGSVAEVEDLEGEILAIEELVPMIHAFMAAYYAGHTTLKINHDEPADAVIVESAPQYFGGRLRWYVGVMLLSEALREQARRGEIVGFSIHGEAVREDIDA